MQMQNGTAAAAGAGPKERGFVIEIICTTPNASGASFVLDRFVSKLKTLTSSNSDVKYQVDKVDAPVRCCCEMIRLWVRREHWRWPLQPHTLRWTERQPIRGPHAHAAADCAGQPCSRGTARRRCGV